MVEPNQNRASEPADDSSNDPRIIDSHELLQGHVEILIRHGDEIYRLRETRNGKLIPFK